MWYSVFHLGAVEHGEAQRDEQLFEFALDARDGMQVAAARAGGGQREIEPFAGQAGVEGLGGELLLAFFGGRLQALAGGIQQLAEAGAVLDRQLAHFLAGLGEPSLAAERLHAGRFQLRGVGGGGHTRQGTGLHFLNGFVKHLWKFLL